MKKAVLTLSIVLASLLGASAFAQSKGEADPEQSKAMPTKPATKAEKAAAKTARKAEGKKIAKETKAGDDQPGSTATHSTSKSDRKVAKSKRKTEGAKATKEPKDVSGPSS